jgi:hypothetical protein
LKQLQKKAHNLATDQLTIALSNSAPTASNTVLANITEITYTNLSTRNREQQLHPVKRVDYTHWWWQIQR